MLIAAGVSWRRLAQIGETLGRHGEDGIVGLDTSRDDLVTKICTGDFADDVEDPQQVVDD